MPFRGQRTHPTSGVKGGKPKILPSFKRKRLPKLPATPEAKDLQEQSSIYLKERNLAVRLKRSDRERSGRAAKVMNNPETGSAPMFRPKSRILLPVQSGLPSCSLK